MDRLVFLLKSYSPDLHYAQRLLASFHQYNVDGIPLYIVVPDQELRLFESLNEVASHDNVKVLPESCLSSHLVVQPIHGLRAGYINQEIIKLSFWELGYAENYFCIDSEAEFIRDFYTSDFMATERDPYAVLVEDRELQSEPEYFAQYWQGRVEQLSRIAQSIGWTDPIIRTCHGHTVFSREVLESFVRDFLRPRAWDYQDALAIAPYEFTWYNLWLQFAHPSRVHPREPWIRTFHTEQEFLGSTLRGITRTDLARAYIGVVINGSFSRDFNLLSASSEKEDAVARMLSYSELFSVLAKKLRRSLRR